MRHFIYVNCKTKSQHNIYAINSFDIIYHYFIFPWLYLAYNVNSYYKCLQILFMLMFFFFALVSVLKLLCKSCRFTVKIHIHTYIHTHLVM